MSRYLMTQSLLSSWQYLYESYDKEKAENEFMKVLRREPTEQNEAMKNGIAFEQYVMAYCYGKTISSKNKWKQGIERVGEVVRGSQFQVPVYHDVRIDGVNFLLYGRLDALKAGVIRDIKFSKSYQAGKYINSPQHPMYLECEPCARVFEYVVCNGTDMFVERYRKEDTSPIKDMIHMFLNDMKKLGHLDLYFEGWETR